MDQSDTFGVRSAASLAHSFSDDSSGPDFDGDGATGVADGARDGEPGGESGTDDGSGFRSDEDEEGGSDVTLNAPLRAADYARMAVPIGEGAEGADRESAQIAGSGEGEGADTTPGRRWSTTQAGSCDQDATPSRDLHGGFFAYQQPAPSPPRAPSPTPPALEGAEAHATASSSSRLTTAGHPTTLAAYIASQLLDGDGDGKSPPGSPHSLASSTSSWPASEVLSYPHSMVGSVDGRGGMLTDDEADASSASGSTSGQERDTSRDRLHSRASSHAAGLNISASDLVMPRLPLGAGSGRARGSMRSSSSSGSGSRPSSSSSSSALVSASGLAISSVDVGHRPDAVRRRPSATSLAHSQPGRTDVVARPGLPVALVVGEVAPKTVERLKAQGWAIERADAYAHAPVLTTVTEPFERLHRLLFRRLEASTLDETEADLAHLVGLWLEKESRLLCVYGFQRAPVSSPSLDFILELARLVPVIPVLRSTASEVVVAPPSDASAPQSDADALAIISRQVRSRRVPLLRPPLADHSFHPPTPRDCAPSAIGKWMIWKRVEDAVGGVSPPSSAHRLFAAPVGEERDDDRWAERVAARREEVNRQRSDTLKPAASTLRANRLSHSSIGSSASEVSQSFLRSEIRRQTTCQGFGSRCQSVPCAGPQSFLIPSLPPWPLLIQIGLGVAWSSVERFVAHGIYLADAFVTRVHRTARQSRRCRGPRPRTRFRPARTIVATVIGMLGVASVGLVDEWSWSKVVGAGIGVGAIGVGAVRLLGV